MNFKTTYILFGVLIALLVAVGLMQWFGQPPVDSSWVMEDMHRANIKAEDISTVEISRTEPKEETIVFVRDPDKQHWRMAAPLAFRVDFSPVSQLVRQIVDARKVKNPEDLTNNLEEWGLTSPQEVITLKQEDGKEWKLNIGKQGYKSELVYVTSSGQPKVVKAVKKADIDQVFKNVNDFRTKELLAEGAINLPESVQDIKLTGPGGKELSLAKKGSTWHFVKPDYGEAEEGGENLEMVGRGEKQLSGVRGLLQSVSGLQVGDVKDFVADNVSAADLAKYGLEEKKPATLTIEIKRAPGHLVGGSSEKKELITETLLIGNKFESKDKDGNKEDKYYARLLSEKNVVAVAAKPVEPLLKALDDPASLRNRDLVQIDVPKIDAINIKDAEGKLVQLRHTGEPKRWRLVEGDKLVDADDISVQSLLKALTAKKQVKEFPTQAAKELGLDKPTAEISLWVDGIEAKKPEEKKEEPKKDDAKDKKKDDKKDEKKTEKKGPSKDKEDPNAVPKLKDEKTPTVRLIFGKEDKDLVYVRREVGKESVQLAVPKTIMTDVTQGRIAYLNRKLPEFPQNDVAEVLLTREGQPPVKVVREQEKGADGKVTKTTWKLDEPKELKGRNADTPKVEDIIGDLHDLNAEKLVAEKSSDTDLARMGLTAPPVKVTLTLEKADKKKETRVFVFGKPTDEKDPTKVYAKLGERDLVFIVSSRLPDMLKKLELADPRIFAFDAAKVKGLKLVGWKPALKIIATLDLERKPAENKGWTVKKGPDGFTLDEQKVQTFLTQLSHLSAERFVSFKTPPKPEYGLDEKARNLQIEIALDDGKTHTLTIGDLDKDKKNYYAQSSTVPGDVFLLPQEMFAEVLKGVGYFGK
jgi:hypothetical protein